jgi:hypothetical protein
MKLIDKYINEENKKYIGVIHIEIELNILKLIKGMHFFTITAFQLGSGIVYIFFKSKIQESMIVQYIQTKNNYDQDLYHDIFCTWYMPYWFTALHLRLEAGQVLNDGLIWDNKKFAYNPCFIDSITDEYLITWRKWYSQFFDGTNVKNEKKTSLNW